MILRKLKSPLRLVALFALAAPVLVACGGSNSFFKNPLVNNKTKFSSSAYGVAASPRLTTSSKVKKGGGRYQVGKAYKVAGKWYKPKDEPNYDKTGIASWYGPNFHGRLTANGEIFDQNALSAAHPTLPLPSYVRVTNVSNGNSVMVRVNDRGPFAHGRIIDLSSRTADILQMKQQGTAKVRVQYVGRAPLNGDDTRYLMASINKKTDMERGGSQLAFASGTRLASVSLDQLKQQALSAIAPNPPTRTQMTKMLGFDNDVFDLLASSYADNSSGDASSINAAHAAANQMATTPALSNWQSQMEQGLAVGRSVGTYSSPDAAHQVAQSFALLAIVDLRSNSDQTDVFIEQLRPGVMKSDFNDLAKNLGLNDFTL